MIELDTTNFDSTIQSGLTLVDFNADWCGPCQMQKPILDELAKEFSACQIAGVNIDINADLAREYGVSSIPCMILFQDGREVERLIGLRPKKALAKILIKYLGV